MKKYLILEDGNYTGMREAIGKTIVGRPSEGFPALVEFSKEELVSAGADKELFTDGKWYPFYLNIEAQEVE